VQGWRSWPQKWSESGRRGRRLDRGWKTDGRREIIARGRKETFAVATPRNPLDDPRAISLLGWERLPAPVYPLPGQTGLFEYRPRTMDTGQGELFDSGRDLPGADEGAQALLWDVER
jgi:hypothetical protein